MLGDLPISLRDSLRERFSSPLIGGFVVSWCLWNWKFLVILFSDNSATVTFDLASELVFPNSVEIILRGIIYPLFSTLLYIFVYPYPAQYVYEHLLKVQRRIRAARQAIEEETLLSQEESLKILQSMREDRRRHEDVVKELNAEIDSLKNQINSSSSKRFDLAKFAREPALKDLTNVQYAILNMIATKGGGVDQGLIVKSDDPMERQRLQYELDELVKMNYLAKEVNVASRMTVVSFTHDGRRRFLEERAARDKR